MKTQPVSSQQSQPASVRQCPRCGRRKPWQKMSYFHTKTGKQKHSNVFLVGSLAGAGTFIVLFAIAVTLLYVGWLNPYLHACKVAPSLAQGCDAYGIVIIIVVVLGGIIALFGATITIPVYSMLRLRSLGRKYTIVWQCTCPQCKNEWTVTQEPPAKKLS